MIKPRKEFALIILDEQIIQRIHCIYSLPQADNYLNVLADLCFENKDEMSGVLKGQIVKNWIQGLNVLCLSLNRYTGFFCWSVLWQDTSEPTLIPMKPRKYMNMQAVAIM